MAESLDFEKIKQHWIETSDKDFNTMNHLFKSKDFQWALFIGHIVLEKLLKACVVHSQNKHAPFTHDLSRLAKIADLNLSENQMDWLDTISTFNLNARYDSYKEAFYKKCTQEFARQWIEKITEIREWIKKEHLR